MSTFAKYKNKPVLYYHKISPPSRFVLMTVEALKLDVQMEEVDLLNQKHTTSAYEEINLLKTVPCLVDKNLTITDSHAICTYLVDKYGSGSNLYPKDPVARAKVDSILYFNSSVLFPREAAILRSPFAAKHFLTFEHMLDMYTESLKFLEAFCKKSPWLSGEHITLADFCCICTFTSGETMISLKEGTFPAIKDWAKRCKATDTFRKASQPGLEKLKQILKLYGCFDHLPENHKEELKQIFEEENH